MKRIPLPEMCFVGVVLSWHFLGNEFKAGKKVDGINEEDRKTGKSKKQKKYREKND